jgi:hypothetical protein
MTATHCGFIYEQPKQEDFVFGDASIDAPVLQPDGNWTAYLPKTELQNLNLIETYACASFGTLNCIEILLRRLYNFEDNFSDRYLAKISGTQYIRGNSPHTVAEIIRHNGAIDEHSWPFTADVTTFERFYTTPPAVLADEAKRFNEHYTLRHDYVPNDPTSMMEALKYSPLGMSVYGWTKLENGLYAAGNGADTHWVCVYGYEKDIHWKVFDSYDNTFKMVEWKHRPLTVKRYHIELAPQTISWLEQAIQKLKAFLASFK